MRSCRRESPVKAAAACSCRWRITAHLENLAPNFDTLLALGNELDTEGFFVFAVNRDSDEIWTESRMFCPALGIPEDPVSGNAHAMLARLPVGPGSIRQEIHHLHRPAGLSDEAAGAGQSAAGNRQGQLDRGAYRRHRAIVSEGTLAL